MLKKQSTVKLSTSLNRKKHYKRPPMVGGCLPHNEIKKNLLYMSYYTDNSRPKYTALYKPMPSIVNHQSQKYRFLKNNIIGRSAIVL